MDTWKFYDITHREHVVCNPTSEEKLTRLVELLRLPTDAQVVDIACGKGEFRDNHGVRSIFLTSAFLAIAKAYRSRLFPKFRARTKSIKYLAPHLDR